MQKLELFGDNYIMQYINAKIRQENAEKQYRYYLTDVLKAIAQNTANIRGGTIMTVSYRELVESETSESKETAEEIISRMCDKLKTFGREEATE